MLTTSFSTLPVADLSYQPPPFMKAAIGKLVAEKDSLQVHTCRCFHTCLFVCVASCFFPDVTFQARIAFMLVQGLSAM